MLVNQVSIARINPITLFQTNGFHGDELVLRVVWHDPDHDVDRLLQVRFLDGKLPAYILSPFRVLAEFSHGRVE